MAPHPIMHESYLKPHHHSSWHAHLQSTGGEDTRVGSEGQGDTEAENTKIRDVWRKGRNLESYEILDDLIRALEVSRGCYCDLVRCFHC